MLLGNVTREELYRKYPVFEENAARYRSDPQTVDRIRRIDGKVVVVMFLGTWCGDSVREAPKLLELLDSAKNAGISLTLRGVDSSLDDGEGMAKTYGIERVPTIILLRGEEELGRIVEPPDGTMERDFLKILESERP